MSQALNNPAFVSDRELAPSLSSARKTALAISRWQICAVLFGVLVFWAYIFPYSGDGDSAPHYLNARDAAATPISAMHAWARPGIKLLMSLFAMHGIFAVRVFMAALAALTAWQTMRLADELGIRNSLLAGPMIFWQPMAFALAADTMTEIPMALGIITAIRLWRNGWWRTSALLVGFLPSVRPEGFFLGVLWGAMLLFAPAPAARRRESMLRNFLRRLSALACLSVGLFSWAAACWALTFNHDILYVLHIWNWPPGSYAAYGKGSLFHHVILWPVYCGVFLSVLFVIGIKPALRREMMLPWAIWGIVFGVHSILYWGGWFASCGIMRIFTSTAPATALICLYGWNAVQDRLIQRRASLPRRRPHRLIDRLLIPRTAGIIAGIAFTIQVFAQYLLDPGHFECFPIARCTDYIQSNELLSPDTPFFAGNAIATAILNFPGHPANVMETPCDPEQIRKNLAALPIGAIGIWDNRQAPVWHGHKITDLVGHGFTLLYETRFHAAPTIPWLFAGHLSTELHYVVLRKDGPFLETKTPN